MNKSAFRKTVSETGSCSEAYKKLYPGRTEPRLDPLGYMVTAGRERKPVYRYNWATGFWYNTFDDVDMDALVIQIYGHGRKIVMHGPHDEMDIPMCLAEAYRRAVNPESPETH